jgi:Arsenate reductase and related proteins, glutaredoxin family
MIRLYYGSSSTSSRMAYAWFKNRALEISIRKTKYISKEDLLHILRLSNNGFSDILKSGNKSTSKIQQKIELLKEMKFNDGLNYIMENPEVLRVPIIFDEKKLLIGYNSEEIRKFTPALYRRGNNKMDEEC